jgi:SH3-like domain-containing protein
MFLLALLAITMFGTQQSAQVPAPVTTYRGLDLCNYAEVKPLQSAMHLIVRSGPGKQFQKIDQLEGGAVVYTCDEHADWLKIYYATGPCSEVVPQGLDAKKAQMCKSGWVNRKWIEIISG